MQPVEAVENPSHSLRRLQRLRWTVNYDNISKAGLRSSTPLVASDAGWTWRTLRFARDQKVRGTTFLRYRQHRNALGDPNPRHYVRQLQQRSYALVQTMVFTMVNAAEVLHSTLILVYVRIPMAISLMPWLSTRWE